MSYMAQFNEDSLAFERISQHSEEIIPLKASTLDQIRSNSILEEQNYARSASKVPKLMPLNFIENCDSSESLIDVVVQS